MLGDSQMIEFLNLKHDILSCLKRASLTHPCNCGKLLIEGPFEITFGMFKSGFENLKDNFSVWKKKIKIIFVKISSSYS